MTEKTLNKEDILKKYDEGQSPYEIAEFYGTYANKIRRFLKKHVPLRGKSEAQKVAIKSGRVQHPTEGKNLSEETKTKISSKLYNSWKNKPQDQIDEHAAKSKERWNQMTNEEKKEMQEKAFEAIRKTAKDGSKLERAIFDALEAAGFNPQFHRKNLVVNENLEADIYIADLSTIIEIDGPSHFLPIWGEDKLKQVMAADADKNGLAIDKGFVIIRVKCLIDSVNKFHQKQGAELVLNEVQKIKTKRPPKKDRYIELEIK